MRGLFIIALAAALMAGSVEIGQAYEVMEVKDGGTLVGEVKFVGEVPKLDPIPVPKDQNFCGKSVPSEALIVSPKTQRVKNAVVYLEGIAKGKQPSASQMLLDINKCLMVPHVQAMMRGAYLAIRNSDPLLHNMHARLAGKRMVFNMGLPIQGMTVKRRIRRPGVVTVTCDPHPHMRAYLLVLHHPYYAVTDENGAFTLADVPPGKYRLTLWHESWKIVRYDEDGTPLYDKPVVLSKEVEVSAKGTVHVNFELK